MAVSETTSSIPSMGESASLNDALQDKSMQTNWVTTETLGENTNGNNSPANTNPSASPKSTVPKTPALLEAQGWVYRQNSELILTAQSPTITLHHPSLTPAPTSCNVH